MTEAQRLTMLKGMLDISGTSQDASLTAMLQFAMRELICWKYEYSSNPDVASVSNDNVTIKIGEFIGALNPVTGTDYTFTYSESDVSWVYESVDVSLEDYGLYYSEYKTPVDEEEIIVKYNESKLSAYDTIIVSACVAGYGLKGLENETSSSENGIVRAFKYIDITDYIRNHVPAVVGVL